MSFADISATVLEFVRQHPNWAAFIVFALSFGESLPFVSLILPIWAALLALVRSLLSPIPSSFGPSSPQQGSEPHLAIMCCGGQCGASVICRLQPEPRQFGN